jgi:hypothetical protein
MRVSRVDRRLFFFLFLLSLLVEIVATRRLMN